MGDLHYLEENMLSAWQAGINPSLNEKLNEMRAVYTAQKQQQPLAHTVNA